MRGIMTIKLSDETQRHLLSAIRRFFEEDMDQNIGDLKASLLLEFFRKELGPSIYNTAISDAQTRLQHQINDLDVLCYEPEFNYWKR